MEPMQRSEGHASGSVMALSDLGEEMKDGDFMFLFDLILFNVFF